MHKAVSSDLRLRMVRSIAHRLFASHADRDTFLNGFVHDYNHTRLKCLGYQAPLQALANLAGPEHEGGDERGQLR